MLQSIKSGSFLLGLLVQAGGGLTLEWRTALGTGFLGGFTTFSTLTVQTVVEADDGRVGVAVTYLLVSVLGGLGAACSDTWPVGRWPDPPHAGSPMHPGDELPGRTSG